MKEWNSVRTQILEMNGRVKRMTVILNIMNDVCKGVTRGRGKRNISVAVCEEDERLINNVTEV